jgi:hypothetical protein
MDGGTCYSLFCLPATAKAPISLLYAALASSYYYYVLFQVFVKAGNAKGVRGYFKVYIKTEGV